MSWPCTCSMKFSTKTSTEKCATEPALEVGMLLASPRTKIDGCSVERIVCLSTGT